MSGPVQIRGRVVRATDDSLVVDAPGWPGHRPGQFAMLQLDPTRTRLDPLLPRPMAIYRHFGRELEFRFKVTGRGTALMARAPAWSELGVVGPLGNGFDVPTSGRSVLVGGGTGIASLYELGREARGDVVIALGGRTARDVLGLADFEALANVDVRLATEDGSAGAKGLVTALLDLREGDQVFACGPGPMMRAVAELARAAGAGCRVSLEEHMACGFGICLGCVVPTHQGYRYVCTHGPVFAAEDVDWERAVA